VNPASGAVIQLDSQPLRLSVSEPKLDAFVERLFETCLVASSGAFSGDGLLRDDDAESDRTVIIKLKGCRGAKEQSKKDAHGQRPPDQRLIAKQLDQKEYPDNREKEGEHYDFRPQAHERVPEKDRPSNRANLGFLDVILTASSG